MALGESQSYEVSELINLNPVVNKEKGGSYGL